MRLNGSSCKEIQIYFQPVVHLWLSHLQGYHTYVIGGIFIEKYYLELSLRNIVRWTRKRLEAFLVLKKFGLPCQVFRYTVA